MAKGIGDGFGKAAGGMAKGLRGAGVADEELHKALPSIVDGLCAAIRELADGLAGFVSDMGGLAPALSGLAPAGAQLVGTPTMVNNFYFDNIAVRSESDMEAIAEFTLRKMQIALNNRGIRV
jgi:hypothetical protein